MNKFEKSNPHTTKASNTKLKPIIFGPPNAKTLNSKSKFWAPKKIEEKKEYDFRIFPRTQHKINLNQHKTQQSETQRSTTQQIWNPTIWSSTQTTNPKPPNPSDPLALISTSISLQGTQAEAPQDSFVVDHDSHKLQWVLFRLGLGFHIKFSADDFFLLVSAWVSIPRPLFPSHLLWLGLSSMRGWSAELERAKGRSWTTRESERGKECVCVEVVGAFNFFSLF